MVADRGGQGADAGSRTTLGRLLLPRSSRPGARARPGSEWQELEVVNLIGELAALGIGLSAGLLDTNLYAVLLIMAVMTTVATSPSLRLLGFLRTGDGR